MKQTILGKKLGMTQIFDEDGRRVPVTVVQAGPCAVLQVKSEERDGYHAVQLGFDAKKEKRCTKPELGHFKKTDASPRRFVREVRLDGPAEVNPGDELKAEIMEGVKLVDVQGTSKGKGTAGTIKRWGFHGGWASHGASRHHRKAGAIGRQTSLRKGVPKGKKMAGRLGGRTTTIRGLRLARIDKERSLLLIRGAVPGANGGYVVVRKSNKERG